MGHLTFVPWRNQHSSSSQVSRLTVLNEWERTAAPLTNPQAKETWISPECAYLNDLNTKINSYLILFMFAFAQNEQVYSDIPILCESLDIVSFIYRYNLSHITIPFAFFFLFFQPLPLVDATSASTSSFRLCHTNLLHTSFTTSLNLFCGLLLFLLPNSSIFKQLTQLFASARADSMLTPS